MKLPFMFGIHCHQPADNFHYVVDDAVAKSYSPFLKVALANKKFKFAAHYSGWLLEYIREKHADVFADFKKLADDDQIEFFTGGFYEPVLSAIPSDDRRGQIEKLSKYIKNHFGQSPDGMWLTERVWDPAIVPDAYECGVRNVIVDDYHFIAAGFPKECINGYFTTEQDGCGINLFPIDVGLRYLTPFKPQEAVLKYMKEEAVGRNFKLITCFDDGEKFGIWPQTYDHVYKNGWLDKFIKSIVEDDEIEFMHYKEAAATIKPVGSAYLPITSYVEMGEWSLFADMFQEFEELKKFVEASPFKRHSEQFIKGSIWKNFLVKYPESNRLHKRTVDLSLRAKPYKKDAELLDALYKSECNDSLWHGVFGGLYLPNLRNNAWAALIEAEARFEKLAKLKLPSIEVRDADMDGFDEVIYRGKDFNAMFVSRDCGQLATIELKKERFNLLNVISRKREGYHEKYISAGVKKAEAEAGCPLNATNEQKTIHEQDYAISEDAKNKIAYDWYNKNCFVDHFSPNFNADTFEKCSFHEASDFTNQAAVLKHDEKSGSVQFSRDGGIFIDNADIKTTLVKKYSIENNLINLELTATSEREVRLDYINECNFHFANLKDVTINGKVVEDKGVLRGAKFVLKDGYTKKTITLEYDREIELMYFIIYTVSQSESGIDLTSQGLSLGARFAYDGRLKAKISLKVE